MIDKTQVQREVPDRVRRHIYWANGTIWFLIFTGGAWLISGAYALFGFDLFGSLHHENNERTFCVYAYSILAIFAPIATGIMATVLIRRALYLAKYGIEVTAKVTSVRPLTHILSNVHYEYVIGSQTITGRISTASEAAKLFRDGKPLVLIVDPRKPKRFMMKYDVFPAEDE